MEELDDNLHHPATEPSADMNCYDHQPRRSFKDSILGGDYGVYNKTCKEKDEPVSDDDEAEQTEDDEDCPTITLTKKEKACLRQPWRRTLIIKVWGRSVGYNYLLKRLQMIWKPKASMDLIGLSNGYFLVKFGAEEDYKFTKFEGPWMILDHYLIVKEWSHDFDPLTDTTEKILVWVRFPCIPIEYYDTDFLMRLGKKIGKPIRVDDATSLASRGLFARMCIEIDIGKPLLAKFKLRKRIRKIEYEGIHLICFRCGVYGHHQENCLTGRNNVKEADTMEQAEAERNKKQS